MKRKDSPKKEDAEEEEESAQEEQEDLDEYLNSLRQSQRRHTDFSQVS